jgi:hypothetical protein
MAMKFKHTINLLMLSASFLAGCGKCEKLNLSHNEKDWVNHFQKGQNFAYKNLNGKVDTLQVKDTSNYYTQCNKIELSRYQFEIYLVIFKLKSQNHYNNDEPNISITTQTWEQRIPYIHFGNLGPHRNDLENKMPIEIDTVLNGIKLKSVYYYAKGLNTEQYGDKDYFKNFFWNKESGLVAYTTMENEVFLRTNELSK